MKNFFEKNFWAKLIIWTLIVVCGVALIGFVGENLLENMGNVFSGQPMTFTPAVFAKAQT